MPSTFINQRRTLKITSLAVTLPSPAPSNVKRTFNEGVARRAAPSRFTPALPADCPDDIRALIDETRAKIGFVPNVFLAYAERPEHFRAFMQYHDLLMKGPSGLSRAEREAIVVVVSAANECQYCVAAHGAALRILGNDRIAAEQIAINWRTADLEPRLRAILAFACEVNERGFAASDERVGELRGHGFSDHDIWDIAAVAAFFGFSNRMAGALDLRPNPEFYAMGRTGLAQREPGAK